MNLSAAPPRILAATDLSDPAAEAIRQADAHTRSVGGALAACHVLPSMRVHMLFPQNYAREALDESALDNRVRATIGASVTSLTGRAPTSFEVFVQHGSAYAEIVRCAETWRATLIAVGGDGRSDVADRFLGSVPSRVVRYAHCSVLVARPPERRGLVVAATDLSVESLPAVEAAVAEARLRGAKLVVLHVVDQGVPLASTGLSMGITPVMFSPELLHDLRDAVRAKIEAVLANLDAHADLTIVEGHAAPTIVQYLEAHRPELVVVGTRGRTGLTRILLGSVAEHVVRAAQSSVLVVRQSVPAAVGGTTHAP
jgi:nucleotide-binding universal stress UspA family protein